MTKADAEYQRLLIDNRAKRERARLEREAEERDERERRRKARIQEAARTTPVYQPHSWRQD